MKSSKLTFIRTYNTERINDNDYSLQIKRGETNRVALLLANWPGVAITMDPLLTEDIGSIEAQDSEGRTAEDVLRSSRDEFEKVSQ